MQSAFLELLKPGVPICICSLARFSSQQLLAGLAYHTDPHCCHWNSSGTVVGWLELKYEFENRDPPRAETG